MTNWKHKLCTCSGDCWYSCICPCLTYADIYTTLKNQNHKQNHKLWIDGAIDCCSGKDCCGNDCCCGNDQVPPCAIYVCPILTTLAAYGLSHFLFGAQLDSYVGLIYCADIFLHCDLRQQLAKSKNINERSCSSFCKVCWCTPCAFAQEEKQIKHRTNTQSTEFECINLMT